MSSASLSAYEVERLENIRRNNEQLEALGLAPGGANSLVVQKPQSKKCARRDSTENQEPQRRSSRLQHAPAPQVYVEDEADEEKPVKRAHLQLGGKDADAVLAEARAADDPDALPIEPEQLTTTEREVYEIIREVRNAKARSMARSMFIVCGNRTMVEMVRLVPSTAEELLELHGMGELKVQRYGELLLDALRPHTEKLHAEHAAMKAAREPGGSGEESATRPTIDVD